MYFMYVRYSRQSMYYGFSIPLPTDVSYFTLQMGQKSIADGLLQRCEQLLGSSL